MNRHTGVGIKHYRPSKIENMKILLQDCKTENYMRIDSLWTGDISMALDFLSVMRAVSYGTRELKDSFNIVQIDTADLSAVRHVIGIPMENLNAPNLAGVTRYAISADLLASRRELAIV
jgi:hypothetical protein